MNVKQREGESIRSYFNRFNVAILEVHDLDQSVAMASLKDGLLKNGLRYSLEKTYPYDFIDMLAREEKYAKEDKAFEGEPPMVPTEDRNEERLESPSK